MGSGKSWVVNKVIAKLNEIETRKFIDSAFHDGCVKTDGAALDIVLSPMSRFANNNRLEKKLNVIQKLNIFFDKYYGIGE